MTSPARIHGRASRLYDLQHRAAGVVAPRAIKFGTAERSALVDQGVLSGTNFLTTVIIGRLCGAGELGAYSLGVAALLVLGGIQSSLILSPYTVFSNRGKYKDAHRYAGSVLAQQGLMMLLGMLACAAGATVVLMTGGSPQLAAVLWALVLAMPLFSFREFARRIMLARLHVRHVLALDVTVLVVQTTSFALLAAAGLLTAVTACAAAALACGLAAGIWFACTSQRFTIRAASVRHASRRHWSFGRWICGGQLTDIGQDYGVHYMLIFLAGTAATGIYAACWSIVMICNPLILGVGSVLMPRAAQAYSSGGSEAIRRVIRHATLLLGSAMTVLFGAIAIWGGRVVELLFDEPEYAGHGMVVSILAINSLISALAFPASHGLNVIERPDINFKSAVLGLSATIVVTGPLIWIWGVVGAAVGVLLGVTIASTWQLYAFDVLTRPLVRQEDSA